MLHRSLLPVGGLAALGLLLGCDQTSPVSPSSTSSPIAANTSRPRPWKESYQASGTIAPGAPCPTTHLLVILHGGGTATHIGKYTIVNSHCVDPTTGELTQGTFVKTAANGDQILGEYSGWSEPTGPGTFSIGGTIVFDGGSGRFADASGTATMAGTLDADFSKSPVPAQVRLEMVGSILY